jgi:hypothetical protein
VVYQTTSHSNEYSYSLNPSRLNVCVLHNAGSSTCLRTFTQTCVVIYLQHSVRRRYIQIAVLCVIGFYRKLCLGGTFRRFKVCVQSSSLEAQFLYSAVHTFGENPLIHTYGCVKFMWLSTLRTDFGSYKSGKALPLQLCYLTKEWLTWTSRSNAGKSGKLKWWITWH